MIVSDLSQVAIQLPDHPGLKSAVKFLAEINKNEITDGRIDIEGIRLYALFQTYSGKPDLLHPRFEVHQKYLDVQYIVSGKELFGWALIDQLENTTTYNPEKDVQHGTIPTEKFTLTRLCTGNLAIVYPSDAHAPGLADGEPSPVKKIVVKVLIDW
jgi:YhcH/YjgK/YiaL family protein